MKRIIISSLTVVMLVVMMLPATNPSSVLAGGPSVDFTQYANVDNKWINSILQQSNSMYYEGMSVPQRTILDDIASTADDAHTFTFSHEATKGGTHAYDWLTAYNQGNVPPLAFNACGEKIGHTPDFATICKDLHSSGYSILVDVPDDPFVSKDGPTQDRIDAYEAQFGNRQIKIYGNEQITTANLTLSHTVSNTSDTGDSHIEYVLNWTSNSTQVLIEMAGHLAVSGNKTTNPIAWGPDLGASQVSGGPYHFKLDKLDGASLGSLDNQIKGADILKLGSMIIAHKFNDLNTNGAQDVGEDDLEGWTMTLYEGSNCTGDPVDSGTTESDGNMIFDGLEAGTYSVRETLKSGWTNTTALCQQVTIGAGDNATLDFGNFELKPDIDVEKTASPTSGAACTNVTFNITVENTGNLTLDPVKVVDTIPEGMTYVSTGTLPAPDSSTHNPDGTWNITWNNVGPLEPGNTTTIYLVAHIDGDVLGTLTNNVTATGTPTYGDDVEDSDIATVLVVDARISISPPEATNVIGDEHELTAKVQVNDGTGWENAQDVTVHFTKTAGVGNLNPLTDVTDASGEATTILTSTEAGNSTVQASANMTVEGVPFILVTDGTGENSEPAEKIWIQIGARISIYESGVNPVGTPHIFTVHVEKNEGRGAGWVDAIGVSVNGTISGVGNITSTLPAITDGNGEITITVNSAIAGMATVHASTTVHIDDNDIEIATNGYGSYYVSNTKTWRTERLGGGGACCCPIDQLTVDWEGCITSKPLYTNDKLAVDLLGPSPDSSDSLFLERETHAPVVGERTYYLIVVRELEDIPPVPENYQAIVVLNVTPADAEFNKDIFLTVGLNQTQLPQNVLNLTMAYYDDVNGLWETLDYEAGGPSGVAELTLSAPINHFSIYGILAELAPTPPQPAHFVAGGLNIIPSVEKTIFVTKTGESVTIAANIANDGGQDGTYTVVLKLNGETVATKTVTLGAGQSRQVSFNQSGLDYGQYDVEVAGLSGEFTTSRTITWWLIILIIVAIGLIIWGVVWGRRRRRKAAQEG